MRSNYFPTLACGYILALLLSACGQAPTPQQRNAAPAGPFIQFSTATPVPRNEEKGNWCRLDYPEAVLINADAADFNRRFFKIEKGLYKINIHAGTTTNSFILRQSGEKSVDLFTGLHFPECLSSHRNYTLAADGSVAYDNRHKIQYTMHVQYSPTAGLFVVLDLPKDSGYGLTVHRKADWE
jgi:hypothetical protein